MSDCLGFGLREFWWNLAGDEKQQQQRQQKKYKTEAPLSDKRK